MHHKAAYASGVSGNVLTNDWEPDGETMTVSAVGTLPQGLTLNSNGSYTYTSLPAGALDRDRFVHLQDQRRADESSPVQAVIEVYDAAPIALEDVYRTRHGDNLSGNVLTNDFDADDAAADLTAELVNDVNSEHGTLTLSANGSFTLTRSTTSQVKSPSPTRCSTANNSAMNVTIMVTNSDPIGILDFYYGVYGLEVNLDAGSGVLKNDLDMDDWRICA